MASDYQYHPTGARRAPWLVTQTPPPRDAGTLPASTSSLPDRARGALRAAAAAYIALVAATPPDQGVASTPPPVASSAPDRSDGPRRAGRSAYEGLLAATPRDAGTSPIPPSWPDRAPGPAAQLARHAWIAPSPPDAGTLPIATVLPEPQRPRRAAASAYDVLLPPSPTSTIFTAAVSGGLVVGGVLSPSVTFAPAASGGTVLGGDAEGSGNSIFTAAAAGGGVMGGTAAGSMGGSAPIGIGYWPTVQKPPRGAILDRTHPLARGLVGFWPFNEGAGPPLNIAAPGLTTTNTMTWSPSARGMVLGNTASTLAVQVVVPRFTPLDIVGTGITWGAWVYPKVSGVSQVILAKDIGGSISQRQYTVSLATSGVGAINVAIGGASGFFAGIPVTPNWVVNAWNAVHVSYDGATIRVYINGNLAGTQALAGSVVELTTISSIWMGYDNPAAAGGLNGYLDAPAIWNRTLSSAEIAEWVANPWAVIQRRPIIAITPLSFTGQSSGGPVAGGTAQGSETGVWAHVQGTGGATTTASANLAVAFAGNVTAGNLIVVSAAPFNSTLSVADSAGNSYQLVLSNLSFNPLLYVWFATAKTTGALTVTVTFNSPPQITSMAIDEYSYSYSSAVTYVVAGDLFAHGSSNAPSVGPITYAGNGLDYAAIGAAAIQGTVTAGSGYVGRFSNQFVSGQHYGLLAEDQVNDQSGSATPAATYANSVPWTAIGVVFLAIPLGVGQSSGGAVAGGTAAGTITYIGTASGGLVAGGSLLPELDFVVTTAGGMVAGGDADGSGLAIVCYIDPTRFRVIPF